jgi:hypothetical protein
MVGEAPPEPGHRRRSQSKVGPCRELASSRRMACRTSTRKAAQDPIPLSLVIAYTIHEQAASRFHARDCSVLVLPDRTAAVLLREIFHSNLHDSSAKLLLSIDAIPSNTARKSSLAEVSIVRPKKAPRPFLCGVRLDTYLR